MNCFCGNRLFYSYLLVAHATEFSFIPRDDLQRHRQLPQSQNNNSMYLGCYGDKLRPLDYFTCIAAADGCTGQALKLNGLKVYSAILFDNLFLSAKTDSRLFAALRPTSPS